MSDAPNKQEERRTVRKWLLSGWTRAEVFDVLAKIGAVLVFAFAVAQYISSEHWRKTEFVASQIKEFHADKINKAVLTMLDYDPAHVELFPDKIFGKHVDVEYYQLINAINLEGDFTEKEFQIRQYFEHFLTSLARFNFFVESEAIQPRELCADFSWPVELMTGNARQAKRDISSIDLDPFSDATRSFLRRWQYDSVQKFMDQMTEACLGAEDRPWWRRLIASLGL